MYKYYLFIINSSSYKIYKNNSHNLYEILNTIYHMKTTDLIYGINLYRSLCDTFSVKLLKDYIKNRFFYKEENNIIYLKNKKEITKLKINYSCTIIESNLIYPDIFRIFNIYNKRIFIIDMENKKYFWLNEINNLKLTKRN